MTEQSINQEKSKSQTALKQDTIVESSTQEQTEQWLQKSTNCKEYGTTHYPHGWLGVNSDFSGVAPTIDSTNYKGHTFLIEVEKQNGETN